MKYYSEILKKTFDTEDECVKAEKLHEEEQTAKKVAEELKANERKTRAEEVEAARKAMEEVQKDCAAKIDEAQKKYLDLRNAFVKDYGYYHYSTSNEADLHSILDALINFKRIL